MSFCRMFFGPPGTGKTTLAVRFAQYFKKHGRLVYTNFPCTNTLQVDSGDIGKYDFGDAVVILDEAGIDFNNRNWKNFSQEATAYLKLHRHYGTDFIFLSQGWDDCDKKIRTLCDEYYYLKKLGPFTLYRRINKRVGIDDTTKQIIDEYFKVGLFSKGLHVIYRPRWYKFFDSWQAPPLPSSPRVGWNGEEYI